MLVYILAGCGNNVTTNVIAALNTHAVTHSVSYQCGGVNIKIKAKHWGAAYAAINNVGGLALPPTTPSAGANGKWYMLYNI
jgi:hypothetical protein